ncbi:MAG: hypothetical protein ACRD8A_15740 [Candidatus Acidiferrales bacterium]
MGILDPTQPSPPAKTPRYIIGICAAVVAIFLVLWYPVGLRFHTERGIIRSFMNELVSGDMHAAYTTWKPSANYSFSDFLQDWGPDPYWGAIQSYKIDSIQGVSRSRSAAITVDVSPYHPFPSSSNGPQAQKTRRITVWVDPSDRSITFPPCDVGPNPTPCS